jgi:hypothetical protein
MLIEGRDDSRHVARLPIELFAQDGAASQSYDRQLVTKLHKSIPPE